MVDIGHVPTFGVHGNCRPERCSYTVLPIISDHIDSETTVWSDMWAAYNGVGTLPGVLRHETVNHSMQFFTGVHTNAIETYWNRYP